MSKIVRKRLDEVDADILGWLKQQGTDGYQSRLNALPRLTAAARVSW
jgi:uncharacterized protein (DUF4415 family)